MRLARPLVVVTAVALACAACGSPSGPGRAPSQPFPQQVAHAEGSVYVAENGPSVLVPVTISGAAAGAPSGTSGAPIPVGTNASGFVLPHTGSTAWVVDQTTVVPVDLATGKALAPLAAGKLPAGLALTKDARTLYIVDNLNNKLITIDAHARRREGTASLPQGSGAITVTPNGELLLVSMFTSPNSPGVLLVENVRTGRRGVAQVGNQPVSDVVVAPGGRTAWALESGIGNTAGTLYPLSLTTLAPGTPITVGRGARSMAISGDGSELVVLNSLDGTLTPVNLATDQPGPPIQAGGLPDSVDLSPDGRTAWVTDLSARTLRSVDIATGALGAPIQLANASSQVSVSANGSTVWVLEPSTPGSVRTIEAATRRLGPAIAAGTGPEIVTGYPGQTPWVANALSDTVQALDTLHGSLGPAVPVPPTPSAAVLTPSGRTLLVLSEPSGDAPAVVTPIDTARATAGTPITVGHGAQDIVVAPDGMHAYSVNGLDDTVTPINLATMATERAIPVGNDPTEMAITPDSRVGYVLNQNSDSITPITLANGKTGRPITVGNEPFLVPSPDGSTLFVVDHGDQDIRVISTADGTQTAQIRFPGNPASATITPDGSKLLVTDNVGGKLFVISTTARRISAVLKLTSAPEDVVVSPDGSEAFVLDADRGVVVPVAMASLAAGGPIVVGTAAAGLAVPLPTNIHAATAPTNL